MLILEWPESGSSKDPHIADSVSRPLSSFFPYLPHEVYWLKTRMVLIVICQNPTMEGMVKLKSCHYSPTRVPVNPKVEGMGVMSQGRG